MANPEHLAILKEGVEAWNEWIQQAEEPPDLSSADLREADLQKINLLGANLQSSILRGTLLGGATLAGVNLRAADLEAAKLPGARLDYAILKGCNLRSASLGGAVLRDAQLAGADLHGSLLTYARLEGTELQGTNLQRVVVGATVFEGINLTQPCGLTAMRHVSGSAIGFTTIERTATALSKDASKQLEVELFLRSSGLNDAALTFLRSRIREPEQFNSCFISYSHADKPFARRLYDQLRAWDIRCWLDEKDLKPGERILDTVDEAIRLHDKLVICCSKASLESWWVKAEIQKALDRERKEDRLIIIPINLGGYLFEWQDGLASELTSRFAPDFTGWEQDNAKFEEQFERVVEALRADAVPRGTR